MFNYSIVIRTLGNTGEKYRRTLDAIVAQTIPPIEVIVAIPNGYELDHRIGYEKIVRSSKGMVGQRAAGIAAATGDYLLVVDDDIDFPPDFVEKLFTCMQERKLDCVLTHGNGTAVPKHHSMSKARQFRGAFTGQFFFSKRESPFFDTITSTGGHRTYVNHPEGLCQTGAGGCCFVKAEMAREAQFEEETWLDHGILYQYSSYEDAVFYYKLYLQGGRIAYTQTTDFTHLDAAAGRKARSRIESKRIRLYTIARNRTIFWYRLIWSNHRSLHNLVGGIYGIVNYAVYNIFANIHPKNWPAIGALMQGYRDAFRFIRSK